MRHRWLVVSATAVALAGAAGTGATTSAGGGSSGSNTTICYLPLGDVDEDDRDGAVVLLLDGSMSIAGQEGRVTELVDLLDAATRDAQLDVSVGSFGGSDADVRFSRCLDGTPFVARGNNARTRERNRPALLDAATAELTALASGYETSDPAAALRAGVDRLAGEGGRRALVIHTDGIATAGCAALPDETNVSDPELIERLVANCVSAGQLPDADGVDIVIGGIGRTDDDFSAESVTFLIELNEQLCAATGATCRADANLPTNL